MHVTPEHEVVEVERSEVAGLARGVRVLVLMTVLFGLLFAWDAYQDDRTNHRQDDQASALASTNESLQRLVVAREHDRRQVDAETCLQSHGRYAGLQELLRRIGERTDMTDAEVAGLLLGYPPPVCDRVAAQRVLDEQ